VKAKASSRKAAWQPGQAFEAERVLAKHDETYMPREVAEALKQRGEWKGDTPPMIAEIGAFAAMLALALSLAQGLLGFSTGAHNEPRRGCCRLRASERVRSRDLVCVLDRTLFVRRISVRRWRRIRISINR
jgi:hypothetical protein